MIGLLRGTLIYKAPPGLMVDVQGVGYELEAPMSTFYQLPNIGTDVLLYTHLVIREDAHALFGFAEEAERGLFRQLIKVNGVGPKLALTILSGQSVSEFHQSIAHGDTQSLVRLPGVGKKTAERLVIELQDKLNASSTTMSVPVQGVVQTSQSNAQQEAVSALCALGYKPADAVKMVQALDSQDKSCEELIRLALKGVACARK